MALKVFFGKHVGEIPYLNISDGILIRAANDNWNDFGYSSLFDFTVIRHGRYDEPWRFRLGFVGTNESPFELITSILDRNNARIMPSEAFPEFFSMLPSEGYYADFFGQYGRDIAFEYLLALGDVVAMQGAQENFPLLERARRTDIFGLSLIRTTEAFDAFQNSARIAHANFNTRSDSAPVFLDLPEFTVPGFSNGLRYRFKFSQRGLLPKRIAAIIGSNGVGKSYTLKKVLEYCMGSYQRLGTVGGSRVVAVATSPETGGTFPKPEARTSDYVLISASGADSGWNGSTSVSDDIYTLARNGWADDDGLKVRWLTFQRAVGEMLPFSSLVLVPTLEDGSVDSVAQILDGIVGFDELSSNKESVVKGAFAKLHGRWTIRIRHGQDLRPLSSGQLSFVRLAAQLARHVERGSVVLIDEPETHLHPQFISQFISMLDSILGASQSIAIIATHSPYIIREIPNDQVSMVYVSSSNRIEVAKPRLKTFGADVGAISASVFGDELASDSVVRLANLIFENENLHFKWEERLESELSVEAVLMIRQILRERGMQE